MTIRRSCDAPEAEIETAAQLRVLASAQRQDIGDAVAAIGPCSVAELADALALPADGLYYHVRMLARAGLLRVQANEQSGPGELVLDARDCPQRIAYRLGKRGNSAAVTAIVRSLLRSAGRSFARAFQRTDVVVNGPVRSLWAGRVQGRLTEEELREVNRLLTDLLDLIRGAAGRKSGGDLHEFTFILAPSSR